LGAGLIKTGQRERAGQKRGKVALHLVGLFRSAQFRGFASMCNTFYLLFSYSATPDFPGQGPRRSVVLDPCRIAERLLTGSIVIPRCILESNWTNAKQLNKFTYSQHRHSTRILR
jgi:hypothetical protein